MSDAAEALVQRAELLSSGERTEVLGSSVGQEDCSKESYRSIINNFNTDSPLIQLGGLVQSAHERWVPDDQSLIGCNKPLPSHEDSSVGKENNLGVHYFGTIHQHSQLNKPGSLVKSDNKRWVMDSGSLKGWSNREPNSFNGVSKLMDQNGKQYYRAARELQKAGIFELIPRIMTQRAFYVAGATKSEQERVDDSWKTLFEAWWPSRPGEANQNQEWRLAKNVLQKMDNMASQVGRTKQQATEKHNQEITSGTTIKDISDDLFDRLCTVFHDYLREDSPQLKELVRTSETIHSSLDQLAETLQNLPESSVHSTDLFHNNVRQKLEKKSNIMEFTHRPITGREANHSTGKGTVTADSLSRIIS
ncbi:hypothetical protein PCANC_17224 [Puccinia coronata f. sp. avenae]|uniref:Uncharacterized protein n=1 Tax=Puccinia coronata f. sp. avenae TaxID=200324 RepID=A0A2N5SG36_9BASI|nr:hypothetical protein PCANC_17224 [Puccinia coronata f. sp. avenae]